MADEEPAPCFIVIGIVMVVFDIMIIESTYLTYVGGVFVFLGILLAIITENKKQKTMKTRIVQPQPNQQIVQSQPNQQIVQKPLQDVIMPMPTPELHEFCPYCGKSTPLEICPDCGKKID